ncbi:MAG: hypothetical protein ABIH36_04445 [bacterium]
MIKLANPALPVTRHTFHCYCPYCRQPMQVKTHHTQKSVTCPRCQITFTAQNRSAVARPANSSGTNEDPAPPVKRHFVIPAISAAIVTLTLGCAALYALREPQPVTSPPQDQKSVAVFTPADNRPVPPQINSRPEPLDSDEQLVDPPEDVFPGPSSLPIKETIAAISSIIPALPSDDDPPTPPPSPPPSVITPPKEDDPPPPAPVAPAPEQPLTIIQPFGGLTWDDDLLTAFQKTLGLTESKSITVSSVTFSPVAVIDIQSLMDALRTQRLWRTKTILGIDKPVVDFGRIHLQGYPVIIGQGAFRIELLFICEPGYVLDHADECLAQAKKIFGPEADFYCPLRLQHVELILQENTESSTLDGDTKVKIAVQIHSQLKTKYADKKHFISKDEPHTTTWQDSSKHKLWIHGSPKAASLGYASDSSDLSALSQKLQKLQSELKDKEQKNRFAQSEDQSKKL